MQSIATFSIEIIKIATGRRSTIINYSLLIINYFSIPPHAKTRARIFYYRCFLPDLAGFTKYRHKKTYGGAED